MIDMKGREPDGMEKPVGHGTIFASLFPKELIDLNEEIATGGHFDLHNKLARSGAGGDVDVMLSVIASHCEILMNGDYTLQDRLHIATLCTKRLQESRNKTGPQLVPIELK